MSTTDKRPTMRLSEAIRLGATMGPQHFGGLFGSKPGSSCALGAANLAVGDTTDSFGWDAMLQETALCPVPIEDEFLVHTLGNIIVHLNDDHRWTREQIADWVELEEVRLGLYPAADDPITATAEIKETAAHQPDAVAVQHQR